MGKILVIRVKEKGIKGDKCYEYKNSVSISDANMLAIIFNDLIKIYNAPIVKAIELIKKDKESIFPFSP
jgi:hypothetical protein